MAYHGYVRPHIVAWFVFLAWIVPTGNLYAQQQNETSIGLQSQFQREAPASDYGSPDYLFGAYLTHSINGRLFGVDLPVDGNLLSGELSLSIGTLSGRNFKSRRIPLEYRIRTALAPLFNRQAAENRTWPFVYAGVGWMFHRPVKVPAPDDPLTPTQGSSIGSSSLWQYEGGMTPYIPMGVGVSHSLSPDALLDLRFGYHQPIRFDLISRGAQLERGYWGLAFGLRFRFESGDSTPGHTFTAAPPIPVSRPRIPEVSTPKPILLEPVRLRQEYVEPPRIFPEEEVTARRIHFEINSIKIDDQSAGQLEWVADKLNEHSGVELMITGHTDSSGDNWINDFYSWSRARAVWLRLVDLGVDSRRINYRGYRDLLLLEEREREDDLQRRVEFEMMTSLDSGEVGSDPELFELEPAEVGEIVEGRPLFGGMHFSFERFGTEPLDQQTVEELAATRDMLLDEPRLKLKILVRDETYEREVYREAYSRALADWIRAWLISQGIEPNRLEALGSGQADWELLDGLREDKSQKILLIPVAE